MFLIDTLIATGMKHLRDNVMTFSILTDGSVLMTAPAAEFEGAIAEGFDIRIKHFGRDLMCYSPTGYPYRIKDHAQSNQSNFVSFSVTGTDCALKCDHCGGHLLRGMEPALTPESLLRRCKTLKENGAEGVLVSGGSDSMGHVPIGQYADVLQTIRHDLGLRVVVHTGLVDEATARSLALAHVDAAMLDVVGDARVAREVYHIEDGPEKTERSLRVLEEQGVPVVPHILVGLNRGRLSGELKALQMISSIKPAAVVFIVFNPIRNTAMEHLLPPPAEVVGRLLAVARLGLESTPILLGCARPMGSHKVESDILAVKCGVNGIAYICQEGVDAGRALGLRPVFKDICCSLIYQT